MRSICMVLVVLAACVDDPGDSQGPTTLTCKSFSTATRGADGNKYIQTSYFAEVSDVSPTDDFRIELCDSTAVTTACALPNCLLSGDPYPPSEQICQWSRGAGTFANGKLYIGCGTSTEVRDPAEAVISKTGGRYATVRIHR